MVKKIELQPFAMRFSGVFDLETIYQTAKAWYPSVNMGVNWEKTYKDKVSGPGVREVEITLNGYVKLDRYRKWFVAIDFKTWDLKEIQVDGRKMCQGRIDMKINGHLELDFEDMYSKKKHASKFAMMLGKLMDHFSKRDEDFVIKRKCEQEMSNLQVKFRQILQIPT